MGHMKSQIYDCPIKTKLDLVDRISIVVNDIKEMPDVFAKCALIPILQM